MSIDSQLADFLVENKGNKLNFINKPEGCVSIASKVSNSQIVHHHEDKIRFCTTLCISTEKQAKSAQDP